MRPTSTRISKQTCANSGDCGLDLTTAQCEPGIEGFRVGYSGPICRCVEQHCQLQWFEPVSCTTVDDCWVDDKPVTHAIARPKNLAGRTYRGCKDGEHPPACEQGRCTVRALKC